MTGRVLESTILHASDRIRWLDAGTGAEDNDRLLVSDKLTISLSVKPADLQSLNKSGRTAFWRRPTGDAVVEGEASDAQKMFPAQAPYAIEGLVYDAGQQFNPRLFAATLGGGVALQRRIYPSPQLSVMRAANGSLRGSVRFADDAPAAWAVLELTVTVAVNDDREFLAQANGNGDFVLPLQSLPPLSGNNTEYSASLSVSADPLATAAQPVNPDALPSVNVGRLTANAFQAAISLDVVPGQVQILRSHSREYLAVQAN